MNTSKANFLYLCVALAALILPSCKSTKSSARSGFLSSYSGLQRDSNLNKKLTYVGNIDRLSNYDHIFLEEVRVLQPTNMAKKEIKSEDLTRLQREFKSALYKELVESRFKPASGSGP